MQHDLGLALQVDVLLGPAEGFVDVGRRAQRGENGAVALGVHRLHERDVGQHRLFVRGERVGDHAHRADSALDGVQQRQAGEHPHGEFLLGGSQGVPGRDVIGHRHLLGQPEIARQPVPDLCILLVLHPVPVDRRRPVDQLRSIGHRNPTSPRCMPVSG